MLYEFADLIDPKQLPSRRKYLHYYITGFVDGEGCFSISVKKQDDAKFGWVIDPVFHVTQNKERGIILEILKRTFKCGRIIPKPGQEDKVLQYTVDSRRNLTDVIIPFFEKNKPIAKSRQFVFFKEIIDSLKKGEHRNQAGITNLMKKVYAMSEERKHPLEEVLLQIQQRVTPQRPYVEHHNNE
jgi:hypothetical protein